MSGSLRYRLSAFLRSRHTSWSNRRKSFNMSDLECIHIDSCPDVDLGPLHVQLGLISCNCRMVVGIWVEQVRQAVVLLAHSFIGSPDYPLHAPMREINVRQKRCEETLSSRCSARENTSCLRACSTTQSSIFETSSGWSTASSFTLRLTPF